MIVRVSFVAGLCLLAAPVFAQGAAQAPGCVDTVRLKNGGFVRGTIAEHIPGDHVTLVTATGETQRLAADEVEGVDACGKAGEVAQRASSNAREPSPLVVVHGKAARLTLEANRPNVTFMLMTAAASASKLKAAGYDRICTAPCEATLPSGTYQMALSLQDDGDDDWTKVDDSVHITGPGVLDAEYKDKSGLRTAGYVTMGAGGGLGAILVGVGIASGATSNGEGFPIWSLVIGTTVAVLSLATGGVLSTFDDDAVIRFAPASSAAN